MVKKDIKVSVNGIMDTVDIESGVIKVIDKKTEEIDTFNVMGILEALQGQAFTMVISRTEGVENES